MLQSSLWEASKLVSATAASCSLRCCLYPRPSLTSVSALTGIRHPKFANQSCPTHAPGSGGSLPARPPSSTGHCFMSGLLIPWPDPQYLEKRPGVGFLCAQHLPAELVPGNDERKLRLREEKRLAQGHRVSHRPAHRTSKPHPSGKAHQGGD